MLPKLKKNFFLFLWYSNIKNNKKKKW